MTTHMVRLMFIQEYPEEFVKAIPYALPYTELLMVIDPIKRLAVLNSEQNTGQLKDLGMRQAKPTH